MNTSNDILLEYAREREMNKNVSLSFGPERNTYVYDFTPDMFGEFPETEEELKKALGRQWRIVLCQMGSFFEEYKAITSNYIDHPERKVTVLNLSTRAKNLLSIFRSHQQVSRIFRKLMDVKGIVRVRSKHRFGTSYDGRYPNAYAYNKKVERLVLGMVKKYDINLVSGRENVGDISTLWRIFGMDAEKYYKVKVSSKLKIANCTDEECKAILDEKYHELVEPRRQKIAEMNSALPSEQRITFDWSIRRSRTGFITKIGIRASSPLVSLKQHENENPNYTGVWRADYLNDYFGMTSWFEYDVKGSIYRLTRLLNKGEWLGDEVDPYEMMFGEKFASQGDRMAYKSICMPLYFDRARSIINHNRMKTPNTLGKYEKVRMQSVIDEAEASMVRFTGDKFDSEIFLHESLLYVDFVYELRKRGIDVVQVYDGFYMKRGSIEAKDLHEMMRQCARGYFEDYRRWKGSVEA